MLMIHSLMAMQQQTQIVELGLSHPAATSISNFLIIGEAGGWLNHLCLVGSLFLHDINVYCSEKVLQGLHSRGQPMVFSGDVLLL